MGTYSTTVRIDHFLGLYQDGDGIGMDLRYAVDAVNVETEGGVLASAARSRYLQAELAHPIGTLMRLHRRWHVTEQERDVLIAASAGQLYWMLPTDGEWKMLSFPVIDTGGESDANDLDNSNDTDEKEGVQQQLIDRYQSDDWSWVAYEINEEGSDAPIDVLLLSNAKDGMICIRGNDMTVTFVPTPKKFGVITRYAERIWGGAIQDDPDMLVYSAPFNPFDWTQNNDIPEDGAGDVMQPSWDGDSFMAITQFGAQLIALKKHRVWRILGTDPGIYAFREQYGGGALVADTLAVDGERILMLGADGLMRYDGLSVEPFAHSFAKKVFERVNRDKLMVACACMYKNRYVCALPLDGADHNNAVLIFNTKEQTWLLRQGITVQAFLATDNSLFYTSATEPGRIWQWGENPMALGAITPSRWVSPWMDLGAKNAWKGGFCLYLSFEIDTPTSIKFTVRTEKRARTKVLHVKQSGKQYKLVYGGSGKRFRLEIEGCGLSPWRMIGGVQMEVELDME